MLYEILNIDLEGAQDARDLCEEGIILSENCLLTETPECCATRRGGSEWNVGTECSHAVAATAAIQLAAAVEAALLPSKARAAEAAYDRPTVQAAAAATTSNHN